MGRTLGHRARLTLCLSAALACSLSFMALTAASFEEAAAAQRLRAGPLGLGRGELGLWLLWRTVAAAGPRRVVRLLQGVFPQLADTTFFFAAAEHPGVAGLVALTIDDGVCRQGRKRSMLAEVLALLREGSAHATFFLSSDYVHEGDLAEIRGGGHELGNHLPRDSDEYAAMNETAFEQALLETEAALRPARPPGARRWFRAPGGRLTTAMAAVLRRQNVSHALGDVYADDWQIQDPEVVAGLYLRQAAEGSVAIMHMPERGFREHCLEAMRLVLRGLAARGLKVVSLGELARAAGGAPPK